MNILIVTGLYPGSAEGSNRKSSLAIHYYAREWAKTHDVSVIRTVSQNFWAVVTSFFKKRSFQVDGVTVHNRLLVGMNDEYMFLRSLVRFGANQKFDLVIGHMPLGALAAYLIGKRSKIPFIAGFHVTDSKRAFANAKLTERYRKIIEGADLVAFRSPMIEKKFSEFHPGLHEKSFIMPGGISPEWLCDKSDVTSIDDGRLHFITICELLRRKNVHKVVSALDELNDKIDFDYQIVGEGKEEESIHKQVLMSEIADRVKLMGYLSHDEIRTRLKRRMIMILISESETFGLVYVEAMARGCIVVGTKGEGIDGVIIDGENGFLVDPNENDLSQCIMKIASMSDTELDEMSDKAMYSAAQYTYPELAKTYLGELTERLPERFLVNS